jgi:hypothetical protein
MHPLLRPRFPIRLASHCTALWCAFIAGMVLGQRSEIAARPPAAANPAPIISIAAEAAALSFADRWQAGRAADLTAREMPPPIVRPPAIDAPKPAIDARRPGAYARDGAAYAPASISSPLPDGRISRHAHAQAHVDRACGAKGRRYFGRHHRSWRCRR